MRHIVLICTVALLFGMSPLFAQNDGDPRKEGSDFENAEVAETRVFQLRRTSGEGYGLEESLESYEVYDFNFEELYTHVNNSTYVSEFQLNTASNEYLINLQRNDIRSPFYQEAIDGEVIFERSIESDRDHRVETFKGYANGNQNDIVRFTVSENNFWGYIYEAERGNWLFFESVGHFVKDRGISNKLLIYRFQDLKEQVFGECHLAIVQGQNPSNPKKNGSQRGTTQCEPRYLEIATDADHEYFQNNGSGSNAEIRSILNLTEGVYSIYFNILFSVTFQNLWSSSSDPYSSMNSFTRLNGECRPYWNANFSSVDRDLTMLFSGHSIFGSVTGTSLAPSILNPGTICNLPSIAYNLITDRAGNYTTAAHEIGHAFGMPHPFDVSGNTECTSNPGLMCYGTRGFFFNSSSISLAQTHTSNNGSCLNDIDPGTIDNNWVRTWTNDRNRRWIGTWYLNNGDVKLAGDFDDDGDEELLFMSTGSWSNMVDFSCDMGTDWYHDWSNMGNNWIGSWYMNAGDRHYTGDFDGDGVTDLLSISVSNSWATLQGFDSTTNSWYFKWSNMGNNWISSWHVKSSDQFQIADFDGDGKDELLAFSHNGWSGLFNFDSGSFHHRWSNGGNGNIGGVGANSANKYTPGKFTVTNSDELLTWVNTWVTVLRFNDATSQWQWIWSQYGANHFANMYILPLNSQQRVLSGNFDQDAHEEVLNINNTWSATADFNGSSFQQNWNNGGTSRFNDWYLGTGLTNEYLTVKATPHNEKHVMAIKFYEDGWWIWHEVWPELASMYRSDELNNKFQDHKTIASGEQTTGNDHGIGIAMYPNPAQGELIIDYQADLDRADSSLQVEVYDMYGVRVLSEELMVNKNVLDVSSFKEGIYIIQLSNSEGFSESHKIIVVK